MKIWRAARSFVFGVLVATVFFLLLERENQSVGVEALKTEIDSLKVAYLSREGKVDSLKLVEKVVYKTIITQKEAARVVSEHETKNELPSSDNSCDTMRRNYAQTVLHLKNVQEQRNELDTALNECKETVALMEQVDSIKTEQHKQEIRKERRKRRGRFWRGVGVGIAIRQAFGLVEQIR